MKVLKEYLFLYLIQAPVQKVLSKS